MVSGISDTLYTLVNDRSCRDDGRQFGEGWFEWFPQIGNLAMKTLYDARLHILAALGFPLLGYLFSRCWNDNGGNFYNVPRGYPLCVNFDDVSAFGLLPLKWLVAAAVCIITLSIYRIWSGQNSN